MRTRKCKLEQALPSSLGALFFEIRGDVEKDLSEDSFFGSAYITDTLACELKKWLASCQAASRREWG